MTLQFREIRRARLAALSALLATSVFVPAVMGQAASDTAAKKPATTTETTPTQTTKKPAPATAGATKSTSAHTSGVHRSSRKRRSARVRGQKKIDPDRARTIQEALIREHYLSGEPAGTWNQASEDAMRRYQSDHGWQTVEVPDSRALISLGLGPSKDHLLNPESAMTTSPPAPTAAAPAPPTTPASATPPATSPAPAPQSTPAPAPAPATHPN